MNRLLQPGTWQMYGRSPVKNRKTWDQVYTRLSDVFCYFKASRTRMFDLQYVHFRIEQYFTYYTADGKQQVDICRDAICCLYENVPRVRLTCDPCY